MVDDKVIALARLSQHRATLEEPSGILTPGTGLAPHPDARIESGVLAYRYNDDGTPLVLMVTKRRSKRWGIPKGKLKPQLSFRDNAAKVAFEEAGVSGPVSANPVAVFRTTQRVAGTMHRRILEVWVYLLEATECLAMWPEEGERIRRWVTCDRAALDLQEPVLADLCTLVSRSSAERPA